MRVQFVSAFARKPVLFVFVSMASVIGALHSKTSKCAAFPARVRELVRKLNGESGLRMDELLVQGQLATVNKTPCQTLFLFIVFGPDHHRVVPTVLLLHVYTRITSQP